MASKNKKNQPVTFELLTEFYADFIKSQFDGLKKEIQKGFRSLHKSVKKNNDDIQVLRVKMDKLGDQFDGLKAEFSTVPTKKELKQLKGQIAS